jgi:hypothetical protein
LKLTHPRRSSPGDRGPASVPPSEGQLEYKVVELSTVDELSLEQSINAAVARGWRFEGIQFAMRDSSKRPAMAFVLFTQLRPPGSSEIADPGRAERLAPVGPTRADRSRERLRQLAETEEPPGPNRVLPWEDE